MNTPFEIQAFDLNDIGRRGMGRISCLVNGYWSHDPISLYVQRTFNWNPKTNEDNGTWKVEVSHSSGGRQTDPAKERGVVSDLDAATNLGCALIALAALGRQIEARIPELVAAHNAEREACRLQRIAEEAAKAERIAGDPALGSVAAEHKLDIAIQALQAGPAVQAQYLLYALPRGEERTNYNVSCATVMWNGHTKRATFRFNGNSISRKELVLKLAALSARPVAAVAA